MLCMSDETLTIAKPTYSDLLSIQTDVSIVNVFEYDSLVITAFIYQSRISLPKGPHILSMWFKFVHMMSFELN